MNDLLVACAMVCLIVGFLVIPFMNDIAMWLSGRPSHEIGAGESTDVEYEGVLPVGLSATLTPSRSAAGADKPFDWNAA